jgi:hypothetical protein
VPGENNKGHHILSVLVKISNVVSLVFMFATARQIAFEITSEVKAGTAQC